MLPSLARLGVFRLVHQFDFGTLPAQTRDAERATQSTGSLLRVQRDEIAELPITLNQAAAFMSTGNRPLIVVTAAKEAQAGWLPLQDQMAGYSSNSVHRVLPNTNHLELIEEKSSAAQASRAILDVVDAVRRNGLLTRS
ncbi:MAG: hypothetical protein M3Z97_08030 [Candidatus Dormibacteraeota bacterium]|nr:hypothetical protein [Candidatus Dormibacteraeota bacterium]